MERWHATRKLLAQAVSDGKIPGLVAGVTTREGPVLSASYGNRTASGAPIADDSIFWIASMTKSLTSVAVMRLVEQDRIGLDEPLDRYLPQCRDRKILAGFDTDGGPRLMPATRPITLRQLLSHNSGFGENVWNSDIARFMEVTATPTGATGKLMSLDMPLVGEPGTVWQYGVSHDVAGLLVEEISGRRLDEYMKANIFEPAGMQDTTYVLAEDQQARQVEVHSRGPDGSLTPFKRNTPATREFVSGGGTIYSTMADYLRFERMLLNGGTIEGRQILKPATVEMLSDNCTGDLPVSRLDSAIPAMSNSVEILPGVRKCWGLGFMVNLEDLSTGRRAGSLSWAGLGNTYYWIDRASGVGGVLMTQILPFADHEVLELFESFERSVYDAISS